MLRFAYLCTRNTKITVCLLDDTKLVMHLFYKEYSKLKANLEATGWGSRKRIRTNSYMSIITNVAIRIMSIIACAISVFTLLAQQAWINLSILIYETSTVIKGLQDWGQQTLKILPVAAFKNFDDFARSCFL